jgi:hypothetical protein
MFKYFYLCNYIYEKNSFQYSLYDVNPNFVVNYFQKEYLNFLEYFFISTDLISFIYNYYYIYK